ncbi:type I-E CRISPR-associated protein Cas6/Cse3/CasE [Streptomyces sp. URMC 128]|uniref:type I-E CRISPR-associated protein Cas6/Cse3/CasE n=1 Tax=Streptomyces sp. URMC 128 TaxID=3423404 RepID=UPI003F1B7F11
MPYLSKIALNPRRRAAVALLSSPHRLHAAILSGLAVQPVTERVLWRLDSNTPHRAEILVLTASRPSWAHLIDAAGWPGADGGAPLLADYTPLLEHLVRGREFGFRLTANPVQNVPRPSRPSEQQATRLKEEADNGSRHRKRPDGPRVTLSTATFEGRLRVTDPDTLRASLLGGIGPARATDRVCSRSPRSAPPRQTMVEPWWRTGPQDLHRLKVMGLTGGATRSSPRPRG